MKTSRDKPLKILDLVQLYSREMGGGVRRYIQDKMRWVGGRDDIEHVLVLPGKKNSRRVEGRTVVYEVKSMHLIGSKSYRLLTNTDKVSEILEQELPQVMELSSAIWPAWRISTIDPSTPSPRR